MFSEARAVPIANFVAEAGHADDGDRSKPVKLAELKSGTNSATLLTLDFLEQRGAGVSPPAFGGGHGNVEHFGHFLKT